MVPDMELAQRCWVAVRKNDQRLAAGILEVIKEKNMAPWYYYLSHQHPKLFPLDETLLAKMKELNEAEAKRISEVGMHSSVPLVVVELACIVHPTWPRTCSP